MRRGRGPVAAGGDARPNPPPSGEGGDGLLPPGGAEWLAALRSALLAACGSGSGGGGSSGSGARDAAEARQRLKALATTADTAGVSFAGAALHAAYLSSKLEPRARLAFALLRCCATPPGPGAGPGGGCAAAAAVRACLARPAGAGDAGGGCALSVACVGGGPGTDAAGVALLASSPLLGWGALPDAAGGAPAGPPLALRLTLWDLERSWKRYAPVVGAALGPASAAAAGTCDVRRALSHPSNKRLAAHAASAPGGVRLWLFSFVVHETLAAASVGGLAFYAGLAAAAPGPALFAFADVRRASAAAGLAAVWAAMAAACPGGLARAEPLDPAALPAATLVLYKHG